MDEASAAPPLPEPDWAAVRIDYEQLALTRNAVCRKHQISMAQLLERAWKSRWERPDGDLTDRNILINKLLALLEAQLDQMEQTMSGAVDKEVNVLGGLAKNLKELIGMQKAERGGKEDDAETREMQEIRRKLAKRINALTKG
ncbi:MAG: hypothetical protein JWR39_1929 [Devosia sp.]|jgi:hypothetical protein|nr:hypothetical protein [Devosia sp.]